MVVERTHVDVVAGKKWSFTAAIHRRPAPERNPRQFGGVDRYASKRFQRMFAR
jgi:hypothetical protein